MEIIDLDTFADLMRDSLEHGPTVIAVAAADAALSLLIGNLSQAGGLRSVGLTNLAFSTWRTAAVLSNAGNTAKGCLVRQRLPLRKAMPSFCPA